MYRFSQVPLLIFFLPLVSLSQCSLGSEVALRVGGEFFFDPQATDSPVDLVLIAGGVGINPLFSILLHVANLHKALETTGRGFRMGNVKLYYCAKNTSELLFKVTTEYATTATKYASNVPIYRFQVSPAKGIVNAASYYRRLCAFSLMAAAWGMPFSVKT